jgi:hypothetical protein
MLGVVGAQERQRITTSLDMAKSRMPEPFLAAGWADRMVFSDNLNFPVSFQERGWLS